MGLYLVSGFNLGPAEFEGKHRMTAYGLSDPIDLYYYGRENNFEADKPSVDRTEWWDALLTKIEMRAVPRWTELGRTLCHVAKEDQEKFEQSLHDLRAQIAAGTRPPEDFVLFTNGPEQRRDHFIGLISDERGPAASARCEGVAKQVFANDENINRVTVIAWPSKPISAPYSFLGTLDAPAAAAE